MSLFSIYAGLLYNDTFGLMANLFGSAYEAAAEGEAMTRRGARSRFTYDLGEGYS